MYKSIKDEEIEHFADDFENEIQDSKLQIGSISVDDIELEEHKLEEARVTAREGIVVEVIVV